MALPSFGASAPQPNTIAPRLCFVIEGIAQMSLYWPDVRGAYIEPLLRAMDKEVFGQCEACVIIYYTNDEFSDCPLESSGWTRNVAEIKQMLDAIPFAGGGTCETALPEALTECMYMQSLPSNIYGSKIQVPCQCILVSVHEPHRFSVQLPFPNSKESIKPVKPLHEWELNEIVAILREKNIFLSLITRKDRSYQHNLFLLAGKVSNQEDNKAMLQRRNFTQSPSHVVLINEAWIMGEKVLDNERQRRNPRPVTTPVAPLPLTGGTPGTGESTVVRPSQHQMVPVHPSMQTPNTVPATQGGAHMFSSAGAPYPMSVAPIHAQSPALQQPHVASGSPGMMAQNMAMIGNQPPYMVVDPSGRGAKGYRPAAPAAARGGRKPPTGPHMSSPAIPSNSPDMGASMAMARQGVPMPMQGQPGAAAGQRMMPGMPMARPMSGPGVSMMPAMVPTPSNMVPNMIGAANPQRGPQMRQPVIPTVQGASNYPSMVGDLVDRSGTMMQQRMASTAPAQQPETVENPPPRFTVWQGHIYIAANFLPAGMNNGQDMLLGEGRGEASTPRTHIEGLLQPDLVICSSCERTPLITRLAARETRAIKVRIQLTAVASHNMLNWLINELKEKSHLGVVKLPMPSVGVVQFTPSDPLNCLLLIIIPAATTGTTDLPR